MTIPLWAALAAWFACLAAIGIFGLLQSLTLFSFGKSFLAAVAILTFWVLGAAIVLLTISALAGVDWTVPLVDFGGYLAPTY